MSRRRLLAGAGAVGAALVAAACGSDEDTSSNTTGSTSASTTAGTTPAHAGEHACHARPRPLTRWAHHARHRSRGSGDLGIAQLAAGLEVLAVNTYKGALDAAGSGALGEVPPAVAEFVTTAMAHHEAHRDAWNDIITGQVARPSPSRTQTSPRSSRRSSARSRMSVAQRSWP
jgi:hypothetical protein